MQWTQEFKQNCRDRQRAEETLRLRVAELEVRLQSEAERRTVAETQLSQRSPQITTNQIRSIVTESLDDVTRRPPTESAFKRELTKLQEEVLSVVRARGNINLEEINNIKGIVATKTELTAARTAITTRIDQRTDKTTSAEVIRRNQFRESLAKEVADTTVETFKEWWESLDEPNDGQNGSQQFQSQTFPMTTAQPSNTNNAINATSAEQRADQRLINDSSDGRTANNGQNSVQTNLNLTPRFERPDKYKIENLDKFEHKTVAEEWITSFEIKATLSDMPRRLWMKRLSNYMDQSMSRSYYELYKQKITLESDNKEDWDQFKVAFIEKYAVTQNRFTAIIELEQLKCKDIEEYFKKAHALSTRIGDKTGELVGNIILKQFPEVSRTVIGLSGNSLQKPTEEVIRSIHQAVINDRQITRNQMSSDRNYDNSFNQNYNKNRGNNFSKKFPKRQNRFGNQSYEQRNGSSPIKTNHTGGGTPNQGSNQSGDNRDKLRNEGRCFVCEQTGHRARECPKGQNRGPAKPTIKGVNSLDEVLPNGPENGSGDN